MNTYILFFAVTLLHLDMVHGAMVPTGGIVPPNHLSMGEGHSGEEAQLSWHKCNPATTYPFTISTVLATPNPPVVGRNFSISINGTLSTDHSISSVSLTLALSVLVGGTYFPVPSTSSIYAQLESLDTSFDKLTLGSCFCLKKNIIMQTSLKHFLSVLWGCSLVQSLREH